MLAKTKFQEESVIDFDKIYVNLGDHKLDLHRREMILNDDPASKTGKHTINEVRSIFKRCLNIDKDMHEMVDKPLSDDFLNLIEIACSVKPHAANVEPEEENLEEAEEENLED